MRSNFDKIVHFPVHDFQRKSKLTSAAKFDFLLPPTSAEMPDGKSDQAGKADTKVAGSPKAEAKSSDGGAAADGPATEFEKKPKLSKQERRELQVHESFVI